MSRFRRAGPLALPLALILALAGTSLTLAARRSSFLAPAAAPVAARGGRLAGLDPRDLRGRDRRRVRIGRVRRGRQRGNR